MYKYFYTNNFTLKKKNKTFMKMYSSGLELKVNKHIGKSEYDYVCENNILKMSMKYYWLNYIALNLLFTCKMMVLNNYIWSSYVLYLHNTIISIYVLITAFIHKIMLCFVCYTHGMIKSTFARIYI